MGDIYYKFIDDRLEASDEGIIRIDEIYSTFKSWYLTNNNSHLLPDLTTVMSTESISCPSRRAFKAGISEKLGKYLPAVTEDGVTGN